MKTGSAMKLLSCLCLMAVLSAPAYAEGDKAAAPEGDAMKKMEHHGGPFVKMDTDKDGAISKDEMLAHFTTLDGDKDGKVTKEEWRSHMKEMRSKFKDHHKKKKHRCKDEGAEGGSDDAPAKDEAPAESE